VNDWRIDPATPCGHCFDWDDIRHEWLHRDDVEWVEPLPPDLLCRHSCHGEYGRLVDARPDPNGPIAYA
jgi:hypothetical protein